MMDAITYLEQIRFIKHRIKAYEETIEDIRGSSSGLVAKYSDMPKAVKKTGLDDLIIRIEAEITKLENAVSELIKTRETMMNMINKVKDCKGCSVLHMYYVNGMPVKAIGIECGVHETTVSKWKSAAEEKFSKVYEEYINNAI